MEGTFPSDSVPPGQNSSLAAAIQAAHRRMHVRFAAAQMWQGLIGPSDDRWLAGARALTTAPLNIIAQSVTPTSELDLDDIARVRLYANRALTMGSQDTRAELFGTLLATCAHCHAVLRDR